ncbi:MAG: HEAT repeat domain-containing protein [Thermoguttaceae bacterium]
MGGTPRVRLAAMVLGLIGAAVAGCASWSRFGGPVADCVPGVTPPAERIAQINRLAKQASSKDPAQQRAIVGELAAELSSQRDPLVREAIARALGAYAVPEAVEALRLAAEDPNPDVRIAACKALARQRGSDATALLRQILAGDTDVDVRLAAAWALGEIRDPVCVPTLKTALEDRDPAMQYRAVISLRNILSEDLGNDVDRWREYLRGGTSPPPGRPSLVERISRAVR